MDKLNHLLEDIRVDSGLAEGEIFAIGGGGMRKISKINIQPNMVYGMGASSSPSMIFVTKVTKDRVEYSTAANGFRGSRGESRPIIDDLIQSGTRTWIKQRGSYLPKLAKKMQAVLDGKKVRAENLSNWEMWDLHLVATNPPTGKMTRSTDPWYAAEEYGNVGSMDDPKHGTVYLVNRVEGKDYKKLKAGKDKRFKLIKAAPYKGFA